MPNLYHAAGTRADRIIFILEELGVDWQLITLDLASGANKAPDYLRVHPHGWVPALQDGEVTVFETAAICLYLADRYPAARLAPPLNSHQRAAYYQWIVYSVATLEPVIAEVYMEMLRPEAERDTAVLASARERFGTSGSVLADAIESDYLLPGGFSAADVMIGHMLIWAEALGLLAHQPKLSDYAARIRARPAFNRISQGESA